MILSASRRTDIPAFYSQWFFNRLRAGFALVRNPVNPRMVSRVPLTREVIDGIVFWTKNPAPMMDRLHLLEPFPYYFLFTITPYGPDLEQNLPPRPEILDTFSELSRRLGKHRVIWRYDPILLSAAIDQSFHYRHFDAMARRLHAYTERCIISFLDMYKKCERNLRGFQIKTPGMDEMTGLVKELSRIARSYGIEMESCAEPHDFSDAGAPPGKCIDDGLMSRLCGQPLDTKKDGSQRKTCLCTESADIGAYDSCGHGCLYCYANTGPGAVQENPARHHPGSPLLLGEPEPGDTVVERRIKSFKKSRGNLF
jgi:hypothetical protein